MNLIKDHKDLCTDNYITLIKNEGRCRYMKTHFKFMDWKNIIKMSVIPKTIDLMQSLSVPHCHFLQKQKKIS